MLTGEYLGNNEYIAVKKDGTRFPVLIQTSLIRDSMGEPAGIRGVLIDINQQKRVEAELRESEAFNANLLSSLPNPIILINANGSIKYVNPALEKLTGYTRAELIGSKSPLPWWPPEKSLQYFDEGENVNKLIANRHERLFRKKNGDLFWVDMRVNPIIENNETTGYIGNWLDITLNKKTEAQIGYQAMLVDHVSDAIISTDINAKITNWNKAAERVYGWKQEEVLRKSLVEVIPAYFISGESAESSRVQLHETGQFVGEFIHQRKDGIRLNMNSSVSGIKDITGKCIGYVGIFRDITELKKAEEVLRKSEANSRDLASSPPI